MPKNNDTTTKFNADISGLKSAMQDAKKAIAVANSEFKAASSAMDNWAKSTDGISAKLNQLDTTMNSQKTILSSLEQQYDLVSQAQGKDSKAAQDLLIQINNQKAAINNTQKQIDKWTTSLNELQAESNQTARATENLINTINEQESELSQLKAKYTDVVIAQGKNSAEAKKLSKHIYSLSSELSDNKSKLNEASKAADNLDESLDDASDSAKNADSGFTTLKATIANLAADAISKAVDGLKDFVSQANEVDKAVNGLQTSTGATAKEMKQYESVMKEIYNSNYGESYEDVAEAMGQVVQTMGDLNKTDLTNITTNGLALRDTFGFEMNESMRAVNSLMKQFGITADEAYNLIAQGAQNGLNQNDDLLDTINEYSVQFKDAGYSANDMFNMLKNGVDAGTWSVDKLGDAVKEMNIRFSDGTVAEALTKNSKVLGLNAKEVQALQEEYNKGGDSAKNAVGKMIDSILNVKDETEQYKAGVAVFGTMWEDLGGKTIKSLMTTKGGIDSTKQSMEDIKNIKYDDAGNSLQQLGRTFKDEILTPIKDDIMPKLNEFVQYIITNFPQIKQSFLDALNKLKEWSPVIVGIGTAMATYFVATKIAAFIAAIQNGTLALQLMSAAQAALNVVMSMNPIGLIIAAIAGLVAAFVLLWNKSEAFRNFWKGLWDKIVSIAQSTMTGVENALNFIKELPSKMQEWLTFAKNKVVEWSTNMINKAKETGEKFVNNVINFFKNLPEKIGYLIGYVLGKIIQWGINLYKFATTDIPKFINKVVDFFKQLPSKIWTWLLNTIQKVVAWGAKMVSNGVSAASKFISNTINFIKQLPSKIWTWLVKTATKVVEFGADLGKKGIKAAKDLIDGIIKGAKELPSKMLNIGKDVVNGVWKGITNAKDKFVKNVKKFFSGIVDGAKDALDIHSPSRVFRDEVGAQIAEGVIVGIKKKYAKVKKTAAELALITYETAKEKFDTYKKYNDITLANEVSYWKKIVNSTKKGTQGYKDALLEYKNVRNKLNDDIKKAEDDYATKVSDVKTKLINDIQAVTNKYDEAIKNRANSIASSMNLFDEFSSTTEKSAEDLIANLESQVNGIYEWDEALRTLAARGVGDGLITQLQDMGVKSLADIKTLVAMTDEELNKYVALWDIKSSLATDRALEEYKNLRVESQNEIQALIKEANINLDNLEKDYNAGLLALGVTTKDSSISIGKDIVKGLKDGITSQRAELMNYLKGLFESIVSTAKNSLDLTSALSGDGIAAAVQNVDISGLTSMASSLTPIPSTTREAIGGATTVINNYNQTINSPEPLTRLEIYRQSKNLFNFAGGVS